MRLDGFPFASLRAMSMISISDALHIYNNLPLYSLAAVVAVFLSCNFHFLLVTALNQHCNCSTMHDRCPGCSVYRLHLACLLSCVPAAVAPMTEDTFAPGTKSRHGHGTVPGITFWGLDRALHSSLVRNCFSNQS